MNSMGKSYDIISVANALNRASKYKINFYAYRTPNNDNIHFGSSNTISYDLSQNGFIIAPFINSNKCPKILIPDQYGIDFPLANDNQKNNIIKEYVTSYDEYIKQANTIIDYLKKNGGKIVLSRVIVYDKIIEIGNIFKSLLTQYQNAFVFCFSTAQTGTWIGASPELLLKKERNTLSTMSLAGTRPANQNHEWDLKCKEEQQIVTNYIVKTLRCVGLYPNITNPYNKQAGPVEHICTDIRSNIDDNKDILKIAEMLSPTPALSGYPKEEAISKILEIEKHNRRYYGGYVGPSNDGNLSLYVNLRSMMYNDNKCQIYVGGGLTAKSIATDEWNETLIKSKTLIDVIEKD